MFKVKFYKNWTNLFTLMAGLFPLIAVKSRILFVELYGRPLKRK